MTKTDWTLTILFTLLVLLVLVLMMTNPAKAGCAAVYPNICPPTITPPPTPCIPRGWCRGKAPFKPGIPRGQQFWRRKFGSG